MKTQLTILSLLLLLCTAFISISSTGSNTAAKLFPTQPNTGQEFYIGAVDDGFDYSCYGCSPNSQYTYL